MHSGQSDNYAIHSTRNPNQWYNTYIGLYFQNENVFTIEGSAKSGMVMTFKAIACKQQQQQA